MNGGNPAAGPPGSGEGEGARLRLTLYSRRYCHLCHDMEALLRDIGAEHPFELDVVDIDADPALEARFNELVPVLMQGELELARYHLDAVALRAHLARRHSLPEGEKTGGNPVKLRV